METGEKLIRPGTRTDWFGHEVANAMVTIEVLRQEPNLDLDPEIGRNILNSFLRNIKRKDIMADGQGGLSNAEMIKLTKKMLSIKWTVKNFDKIHNLYEEIKSKI